MLASPRSEVIALILKERFGPVISKVGEYLCEGTDSPLLVIKRETDLPYSKVKEALLILIKHQLVTFRPNKNNKLANYSLDAERVLLMLRYPKYLNHVKRLFGDESEMILEELLLRGYWTASELILKVHERMLKNGEGQPPSLNYIKDKIHYLINARYLERLPYSDKNVSVPLLLVKEGEEYVMPNIDIHTLVAYQNDSSTKLPDKGIYWRVKFDRFHEDMRDIVIVKAFARKFDDNVGEIIKLFLREMYVRTHPWAEVSSPVPALKIKECLNQQRSHPALLSFFDEYLKIIELDNSMLLRRCGDNSAGSYEICMKEAFILFTWEVVEHIVLEKCGSKAARIFRLVKSKPYIDLEKIQQLAMIPAKDARKLSYQLYEQNFLHIQELKKSSGNGPVKNFTLFYIDLQNVVKMVLEGCYTALFNHITRKNHERSLNKRVIQKKQRVDAILMGMREQGATEEQLADIGDMITPPEKEMLDHISRMITKLHTVELELDDTIFLLNVFLTYHRQ